MEPRLESSYSAFSLTIVNTIFLTFLNTNLRKNTSLSFKDNGYFLRTTFGTLFDANTNFFLFKLTKRIVVSHNHLGLA